MATVSEAMRLARVERVANLQGSLKRGTADVAPRVALGQKKARRWMDWFVLRRAGGDDDPRKVLHLALAEAEMKAEETVAEATRKLQAEFETKLAAAIKAARKTRDHLLVTGVAPVSEFLDDFTKGESTLGGA